jgi:hypothetical protein
MSKLTPAAQAILEMVNAAPHCGSGRIMAAAALRAAAPMMECVQDHLKLLAIADELEA